MEERPKTVAHLLDLIRTTHAEWEVLLAEIPRERLTEPGVLGNDWSMKDIIAHVTWGEREMIPVRRDRRLQGSDLWNLPTDERNEAMIAESRDTPLDEILAEHDRVYREMIAEIERLEDGDLTDAARIQDMPPDWELWELIAGNTFRHYPEHV